MFGPHFIKRILPFIILLDLFLLKRIDKFYFISAGGIHFTLTFIILSICILLLATSHLLRRPFNVKGSEIQCRKAPLSFWYFTLFLTAALCCVIAQSRGFNGTIDSVSAIIYLSMPMLSAFVIQYLCINKRDFIIAGKFLLFLGIIVSTLVITSSLYGGIYQSAFSLKELGSGGSDDLLRTKLPFGGATGIGCLLTFIWPSAYFQYLFRRKQRSATRYTLFAFVCITISIIFTLSRATMAIVFLFIFLLAIDDIKRRGFGFSRLVLIGLTFLIFLFCSFQFDLRRYKMTNTLGRIEMWDTTLYVFQKNIFFGIGPNTVFKRVDDLRDKYQQLNRNDQIALLSTRYEGRWTLYNPHNSVLWILAEYGIFGSVPLFAILLVLMKIFLSALRRTKMESEEYFALKGTLWGTFAFILQNLKGSFLINNHRISFVFWIYIGIALGFVAWQNSNTENGKRKWSTMFHKL